MNVKEHLAWNVEGECMPTLCVHCLVELVRCDLESMERDDVLVHVETFVKSTGI